MLYYKAMGTGFFSKMMMSSLLLAFGDRVLIESAVDLTKYIVILEIEYLV